MDEHLISSVCARALSCQARRLLDGAVIDSAQNSCKKKKIWIMRKKGPLHLSHAIELVKFVQFVQFFDNDAKTILT